MSYFTRTREKWFEHNSKTDISTSVLFSHVWLGLGWHDIKQRYRRSVLGPFWFTLSSLIMVAVLGVLYSTLFKQDIKEYLPYLGVGLVLWQFISSCLLEGCEAIISSAYMIKQSRMPITIHILRIGWRNFVILMHSLPVVVILMTFLGKYPTLNILIAFPMLLLLLATLFSVMLIVAVMCTRFRDVIPIVGSITQIAFFFTPIMWSVELVGEKAWIAGFNPLYHLIECIRAPILGQIPSFTSVILSCFMFLASLVIAQLVMIKNRDRIVYWL